MIKIMNPAILRTQFRNIFYENYLFVMQSEISEPRLGHTSPTSCWKNEIELLSLL